MSSNVNQDLIDQTANEFFNAIFMPYFENNIRKGITIQEFRQALLDQDMEGRLTEQEINEQFQLADFDENGFISEQEVKAAIKRDIIYSQQQLENEGEQAMRIKDGNEVMIFDWDLLQNFSNNIYTLYNLYVIENAENKKDSYLDLKQLRTIKNPDIAETMDHLFIIINELQYKPRLGKSRLTKGDLKNLIVKYETYLKKEYKQRNQKKSVRKLIENLQTFNPQNDSRLELLKDMFMYMIQKQKHKKYQQEEWFTLINAIHDFLSQEDSSGNQKGNLNSDNYADQLEKENIHLSETLDIMRKHISEQDELVKTFPKEREQYKTEIRSLKNNLDELAYEHENLKKSIVLLRKELDTKQNQIDDQEQEFGELQKQLKEESEFKVSTRKQKKFKNEESKKETKRGSMLGSLITNFISGPQVTNVGIPAINSQITNLKQEKDALKQKLKNQEQNIEDLEEELEKEREVQNQKVKYFQDLLVSKDTEIKSIKIEMNSLKSSFEDLIRQNLVLKNAQQMLEEKYRLNAYERHETTTYRTIAKRDQVNDLQELNQSQFGGSFFLDNQSQRSGQSRNTGFSRLSYASRGTTIMQRQPSVYSNGSSSSSVVMRILSVRGGDSFVSGQNNRRTSNVVNNRPARQSINLSIRSRHSVKSGRSNASRMSGFSRISKGSQGPIHYIEDYDDDDIVSRNSTIIHQIDDMSEENDNVIEEEDDEEDKNDSFNQTEMEHVEQKIDIDIIFNLIKQHDLYFNDQDRVETYKETLLYFQIHQLGINNQELYLVLTKRYLYTVDLDTYEFVLKPIPIDNIASMQLTLNNQSAGIFIFKDGSMPLIFENQNMQQMIIYIKTAFGGKISFTYRDQLYFKNESGEERAFNLIQMMIFEPTDLQVRFADADYHGPLEKVCSNWRSRLSSFISGNISWIKYYYVLKKNILYIFEMNNYDKAMNYLDLSLLTIDEARPKDYGKYDVFTLSTSTVEPMALHAENQEIMRAWVDKIQEAIDNARSRVKQQ